MFIITSRDGRGTVMTGKEMRGRVVPAFVASGERIVVDTSDFDIRRAD